MRRSLSSLVSPPPVTIVDVAGCCGAIFVVAFLLFGWVAVAFLFAEACGW